MLLQELPSKIASFLDIPGQDHFTNYTGTNRGFALGIIQYKRRAPAAVVVGEVSPEREQKGNVVRNQLLSEYKVYSAFLKLEFLENREWRTLKEKEK
jgi:hypothetical protein